MHPAPSDTILLMVCAAAAIILQVQKIGGLVCDFDADLVLVALWVTQVAHCAGQEFRLQICTWGPSSLECIR